MITSVDTNVLLDYLNPSEAHHEASSQALLLAGTLGSMVICEITYAELASAFESVLDLDRFLDYTGIGLERSGPRSLIAAGFAWRDYNQRPPDGVQCPSCGHRQGLICEACASTYRTRQHVLADFLIGAHALVHADQLLTRDRGYYRTYFPELRLA